MSIGGYDTLCQFDEWCEKPGERDSHKAVPIAITPHRLIAAELPFELSPLQIKCHDHSISGYSISSARPSQSRRGAQEPKLPRGGQRHGLKMVEEAVEERVSNLREVERRLRVGRRVPFFPGAAK